jgi:hypothetical protein
MRLAKSTRPVGFNTRHGKVLLPNTGHATAQRDAEGQIYLPS